jgi:hypothetical protein
MGRLETGLELAAAPTAEAAKVGSWEVYCTIGLELGLVTWLIREFRLVTPAFSNLSLLALVGFAVHARLPMQYRLSFFLVLSFVGIALVLGLQPAAWLVAIGLLLVGLCNLPLAHRWRVALVLLAAAVLAGLRHVGASKPIAGLPVALWPALGSMFMFRLPIYLSQMRYEREPRLVRTLAYFFVLPNVCFTLFPVIDYQTFCRSHYDVPERTIYQKGVNWMALGCAHLIIYRLVRAYLLIDFSEATNPVELMRSAASSYLLLLRISGEFHLAVGMLHLFGFNLPATFRYFFFSESFTDLWRRANTYWKDFVTKLFFYPAASRLRKWGVGTDRAIWLATLWAFAWSCLLHSYQWFWIRGKFVLNGPSLIFWSALALLVFAETVAQSYRPKARRHNRSPMALRAVRAAGTFAIMSVLFSLWSSDSIGEWITCASMAWHGLR